MKIRTSIFAAALAAATWGGGILAADSIALDAPGSADARLCENTRLPVGNGSIGALPMGGIGRELVQFNADTLWTGGENLSGAVDYDASAKTDGGVGDYQNFGEVEIAFKGYPETPSDEKSRVTDYSRTLDLSTAVHTVNFTLDGTNRVVRKIFASRPAGLIAMRFEADAPFTAKIALAGAHGEKTRILRGDFGVGIGFDGRLPNGLAYAARMDVGQDPLISSCCGGKGAEKEAASRWTGLVSVRQGLDESGSFEVYGTAFTLYLQAATSFDPKRDDFGLGGEVPKLEPSVSPFCSFDSLLQEHVAEYQSWYYRTFLAIPARDRLATLFNFGRYLLISCSRPGTAPANLQGLWNASNKPAWHSDYHTNINLQMNYWGVDTANLSELWDPVMDFLEWGARTARKETRLAFPESEGVAYRTSLNLFGGGGWKWNFAGAPWMAVMAFDHYRFTGDEDYLRNRAWPLMREAALFALGNLTEDENGEILVKNGWSPEHGPVADGVAHDQQIVRELLLGIVAAQEVLKTDPAFAGRCRGILERFGKDKIGRWGQLQEWREDLDVQGDDHRHTSHLFAVYPGTTISRTATPELAAAARVSLEGRALTGDARRSWTWPWRAALWARFGEGAKAGEMLDSLVEFNLLPNSFTTHPPFQIDGNLGLVGAMCEMLVQSHETTPDGKILVRILPALPPSWPEGEVRGLCVRGGATVDIAWKNGKLVKHTLHTSEPEKFVVALPQDCLIQQD